MTGRVQLFFLFLLFVSGQCYKILLYSTPMGFSHIQLMESVASTLHSAGHDVTVVHPVLEERFRQYWEKSPVKKVYFEAPKEMVEAHESRTGNIWVTAPLGGNMRTVLGFMGIQRALCDQILGETTRIEELKKEDFDIGMFELFGPCGLGLAEILGVKTHIMMSSIGLIDSLAPMFHSPLNPSYVPASMTLNTDKMTFFQRFINFGWVVLSETILIHSVNSKYETVFAKHGHEISISEVIKTKTNYILSNSDDFLDMARPLSRKVKHIGGIVLGKPGNLTSEFNDILSLRSKTIVISFGSVAPTGSMPEVIKIGILKTIEALPEYTFIWKTDKTDLEIGKGIGNLKTTAWMPQKELLNDPRVELFVSHAGLNSLLEAARTGTPAILIPIFGDQFKNAAIMARKNTSIVIEKDQFSEEIFENAVREILTDSGYSQRAARLSELMNTRKETPADRLLEAVEFSGKFHKIHDLDVYGFELGFVQYFCLDVIAVYILLLTLLLLSISKCFKWICCRRKVKTD